MFHKKVAIFALCLVTRVVVCLSIWLTSLGVFAVITVTLSCLFTIVCTSLPLYLSVYQLFFYSFRQMCSYYIYGSLLLQTMLLLDMFVFWSLVSCFATGTFPLSFGGARLSENAVRGWLTYRGKRLPGESLY